MNKLNRALSFLFVLIFIVIVGFVSHCLPDGDNLYISNTKDLTSTKTVKVTVKGEVKKSGSYVLTQGKTYHDALYMAGGITDNADIYSVPMDTPILSDCTIFVPPMEKDVQRANSEKKFLSSAEYLKCNINTASKADLDSLYGIGEVLASRIVEYRENNGFFKSTEELLNIKGMGKSVFNKIKDYITVGGD